MNRCNVSSPLTQLGQALAALLNPSYLFFANNADGRVYDSIVYGETDNAWIYADDGLLPAILFLAEQHYKDVFFLGDYALAPEADTLAPDFGLQWSPDARQSSRTGYQVQLHGNELAVAPSVILLFALDVIERMHIYAYRQVRDWRFEIEAAQLHDEIEQKKIVNVNGLLDLFQVLQQLATTHSSLS